MKFWPIAQTRESVMCSFFTANLQPSVCSLSACSPYQNSQQCPKPLMVHKDTSLEPSKPVPPQASMWPVHPGQADSQITLAYLALSWSADLLGTPGVSSLTVSALISKQAQPSWRLSSTIFKCHQWSQTQIIEDIVEPSCQSKLIIVTPK